MMALFGLPRALFNLAPLNCTAAVVPLDVLSPRPGLTDPRVWFGVVFLVVFWLALRRAGGRDPGPPDAPGRGDPGDRLRNPPSAGPTCRWSAFSASASPTCGCGKPVLAGLALGIGASMKATAWPALLVALALLAVRDGKRAMGSFALTAVAVVAVSVGPFVIDHPKSLA